MMRFAFPGLCAVLILSACGDSKPEGQVIASVNGEEITREEFNAALARSGADSGAGKLALQNSVLDQMISQRLVVQAAKHDGLDKSQQYILQSRSADNAILTDMFAKKITSAMTRPYDNDINAYIAANPSRFSQRTVFSLDQIRAPKDKVKTEWLTGIHSMDQVAQILTAHQIDFQRGNAGLDSISLAPENFKQINEVQPGVPFLVVQGGLLLISSVVDKKLAPVDPEAAHEMAIAMLRDETGRKILSNRLATLRETAKIQYQTGFGPPKTKS